MIDTIEKNQRASASKDYFFAYKYVYLLMCGYQFIENTRAIYNV